MFSVMITPSLVFILQKMFGIVSGAVLVYHACYIIIKTFFTYLEIEYTVIYCLITLRVSCKNIVTSYSYPLPEFQVSIMHMLSVAS